MGLRLGQASGEGEHRQGCDRNFHGWLLPEIGVRGSWLLDNQLGPALADRIDLTVRVEGMVVRLDERASIRRNPLVAVLVAGLDDLAGVGIPEFLLVERVQSRGMGRRVDRTLPLPVCRD